MTKEKLEKDLRRIVRKVHKKGINDASDHVLYFIERQGFEKRLGLGKYLSIYRKGNIEIWIYKYTYHIYELF